LANVTSALIIRNAGGKEPEMARRLSHGAEKIAAIINSLPLTLSLRRSIRLALRRPWVHLAGGKTLWAVFKNSFDAAARDIETHPRGKLFRRLIEFGPHHPDDPKALVSDGQTVLSDPECGSAVEFVFSYMVNRFKGELAELLALEPCIRLVEQLKNERRCPARAGLYWGETIQECRLTRKGGKARWGSFAQGADGVVAEETSGAVSVSGIAEIKSMAVSRRKLLNQIDRHTKRLKGGIRLSGAEFGPDKVSVSPGVVRVIVMPSTWKLSRGFRLERGDHGGRKMVSQEPSRPPVETRVEQVQADLWKVTLGWSKEALEQAAYEMTFRYMAEVGRHVFAGGPMPQGWEEFTPEEAGSNAIKMMLYYMPLRYLSPRQERLAVKLYNVYGFGYPLGVDSREMLWPEDVFGTE